MDGATQRSLSVEGGAGRGLLRDILRAGRCSMILIDGASLSAMSVSYARRARRSQQDCSFWMCGAHQLAGPRTGARSSNLIRVRISI
jgi:hypothetical protein